MNHRDEKFRQDTGFDNIMTGAEVCRRLQQERELADRGVLADVRAKKSLAAGGTV